MKKDIFIQVALNQFLVSIPISGYPEPKFWVSGNITITVVAVQSKHSPKSLSSEEKGVCLLSLK